MPGLGGCGRPGTRRWGPGGTSENGGGTQSQRRCVAEDAAALPTRRRWSGRVRPAVLPVPAVALRAVLGEMADYTLLSSARVLPARLIESGYRFEHSHLESA